MTIGIRIGAHSPHEQPLIITLIAKDLGLSRRRQVTSLHCRKEEPARMGAAERQVVANQSFERIIARRSIQVDTGALKQGVVTILDELLKQTVLLSKWAYSEPGCKPTAAASWRRLRR